MDKEYMQILSGLLDAANKLSACALKNCAETARKVKENKDITSTMVKIMFSKDFKEKEELIAKIASNQDIIDNELCIFNSCKVVYKKLLNVLINVFTNFAKKMPNNPMFDPKNGITSVLNNIKTLIKKKNMTQEDLKTLQKEKTILLMTIMTNK
jgi:hypothetical protein